MLNTRNFYFLVVPEKMGIDPYIRKHGLVEKDDLLYCIKDRSFWIDRFRGRGGDLYGFMKLPELGFTDLWALLVNSPIGMNRLGALLIIEQLYGRELLQIIENLKQPLPYKTKRALKLIKLFILPNGAFNWKSNTELSQYDKHILGNVWDNINDRVNYWL